MKESVPSDNALLKLRAQLSKAEKAARRARFSAPPVQDTRVHSHAIKASGTKSKPPRDGILTDEWSLERARRLIREAIYDSRLEICPHAVQHARAEGFMENDVVDVLFSGQLRAIYTEEQRFLICGYWSSRGVKLPLHVVVEYRADVGNVSIVTAFIPKYPHQIVSRSRLAVLLRYDAEQLQTKKVLAGNKVGYRGKGRWK